jgi:hypothetical protein
MDERSNVVRELDYHLYHAEYGHVEFGDDQQRL